MWERLCFTFCSSTVQKIAEKHKANESSSSRAIKSECVLECRRTGQETALCLSHPAFTLGHNTPPFCLQPPLCKNLFHLFFFLYYPHMGWYIFPSADDRWWGTHWSLLSSCSYSLKISNSLLWRILHLRRVSLLQLPPTGGDVVSVFQLYSSSGQRAAYNFKEIQTAQPFDREIWHIHKKRSDARKSWVIFFNSVIIFCD